MQTCPIFVSSADSYSDLWPIFFDLFKLHWPEFDGVIYLNTEEKEFQSEGLNIVCTQVGKLGHFGKVFRAGLDKVDSDMVLLTMIDYILMGKVDNAAMEKYFDVFASSHWDALVVGEFTDTHNCDETVHFVPNHHFAYQIAFWRKKELYQMALPHENPWTSEVFGSERVKKMNIKIKSLNRKCAILPIIYDGSGCLHQGKWLTEAVEYLNGINYFVDYDKRGYYCDQSRKFREKIRVKWMLAKDGLKGGEFKKVVSLLFETFHKN